MIEYTNSRPARIVGPGNVVITRESLPPAGCSRWVANRKAQVVAAVESGMISIEEVMERYALSLEEFNGWQHAMHRAGVAGLRISWAQKQRAAMRAEQESGGPTPLRVLH